MNTLLNNQTKRIILVLLSLFLLLACLPAAAQEEAAPAGKVYIPITGIDLGVSELTLEPGQTHSFEMKFQPENASIQSLNWFTTDDTVVSIDAVNNTVTALKPGTVNVLAESFDADAFALCQITVSGKASKDAADLQEGSSLLGIDAADRGKIQSDVMNRYLDFIEASAFTGDAFAETMQRTFFVAAAVEPGTEQAESDRALSLGMADATPLFELHAVTLQGTLEQILAFTAGNADLQKVFGGDMKFIIEPIDSTYDPESVSKAVNLDGHTEAITSVSTAHNLGYYGDGAVIAVIDTGLDSNHEQYKGRVIAQRCYGTSGTSGQYTLRNVCGSTTSAAASNAITKSNFAHGSHVTGIAAGKDGIAQKAKIVAVQAFTEYTWTCGSSDAYNYACDNYSSTGKCCSNTLFSTDEMKAYDYLLSLKKNGTDITAINMSYGGSTKYSSACDSANSTEADYFDDLVSAGMIPVVASGNNGWDDGISSPSCISKAYSIGALADMTTPKLARFSNHAKLVDITAPGAYIYSANYPSGYTTMSGTSMATPMVTGAFAILKQAFPNQTVAEYEKILKTITDVTTDRRTYWNDWDYPAYDTVFSYSKPVLNFANIKKYAGYVPETPEVWDRRVVGSSEGILIRIEKNKDSAIKYNVQVTNMSTKKSVSPTITTETDSTGKWTLIRLKGSSMQVGTVYRLKVYAYKQVGGITYRSKTITKYSMPMNNVSGPTATSGDKSVTINANKVSISDGSRYVIYEGNKGTALYFADKAGSSTVWTKSGLTNGKLYRMMATPYKKYNNYTLWGPNVLNIFFVPLSKPSSAKVTFSGSTATVSAASDSNAGGIRVLYRQVGGSLVNGCESSANKFSCKITGLNKNTAYEFYVLKYKTRSGNKFYGPGTVISYKGTASGLTAPSNPVIKSSGNKFTVKVTKASAAKGISVLYRQDAGKFSLLCEAASNTCSKTLSVNVKNHSYSFYIMQYKVVSGKKVYSPGIASTNVYSPKDAEGEPVWAFTENLDETGYADELIDALYEFPSEDDLLIEEATALLDSELAAKGIEPEDELSEEAVFELEDFDLGDYEALEPVEEEEDDEPVNWAEVALTEEGTVLEWDDEAEAETGTETVGKGISAPSAGSSSTNASDLYRLGGDDQQATPDVPSFDRP